MAVNISRTAREADSRSVAPSGAAPMTGSAGFGLGISLTSTSPTRGLPDFRQGCGDGVLGDVLHNFYFADFARQNEVDGSGLGFLVGLHQLEGFRGLNRNLGKPAPGASRVSDAGI